MLRAYREIAREVARATAAPLVQVIVLREGAQSALRATAAVDGVAVRAATAREAVEALLSREPGHAPAARLVLAKERSAPVVVRCEPELARVLRAEGARAPWSAFFRISGEGSDAVLLRVVTERRPRGTPLRALEAVARLAGGRLDAERARRTLAGRDAAYRTLQQSAGEAIFVVDPVTGRILDANARGCEMTGLRLGELRRRTVGHVLEHPALHADALLEKLAAEPLVRDDEIRVRPRVGPAIRVALTAARVQLPERSVLHLLARDVTHERRTLEALRQAKETLAALHLAGAQLNGETDEEAIYGVLARELLRLGFFCAVLTPPAPEQDTYAWRFWSFPPALQHAVEDVLGRTLSDIRVSPTSALLRKCTAEGRTVYTELARGAVQDLLGGATSDQARQLNRLVALRRAMIAPLRSAGRVMGVLVVAAPGLHRGDAAAIDAFALQTSNALEKARLIRLLQAERARLETEVDRRTRELREAVRALEETDRQKDNFLANISHELRTPLVTVIGYADLLVGEKLGEITPKQRSALGVVAQSSRRLKSFIDELLEFSRHELTKGHYHFAAFEIRGAITQAVLALAPRFAERGVRVRARVARATPAAWGDRERVGQVLVNLLANAERYAPEGSLVRVIAAPLAGGELAVAVSDSGAGIADEHVARIFDRLYQIRDDRAPRAKGGALGLGLAIVKSIVDAHGGEVTVRTRLGHGTRFRFTLRSAAAALAEAQASPDSADSARPNASR
jgi:PAS domain S-box-containing protein